MIKSLIKNAPVIGPLATSVKRTLGFSKPKQKTAVFSFERMSLDHAQNDSERMRRQLINVLNYTKTSGASYSAQRYSAGYHTIEIDGQRLQGQRDPAQRLRMVPFDFRGKTVLDIGCNQGGMLFELASDIRWGVGIDYDSRMINAANRVRMAKDLKNTHFFVFNLEKEPLPLIEDLIPDLDVDIVFLLAVCAWISNWREVIDFAARVSNTLLFETTGTPGQQDEQEQYLTNVYRNRECLSLTSEDDPKQKKRKLFLCTNPSGASLAEKRKLATAQG